MKRTAGDLQYQSFGTEFRPITGGEPGDLMTTSGDVIVADVDDLDDLSGETFPITLPDDDAPHTEGGIAIHTKIKF